MALLGPLVQFHQKVGSAGKDDLRIYWDVRVVRGEDTPFMSTSGSSTLPGCLAEKQQANASAVIQQEVVDKIAVPLVGRIQSFVEDESSLALEVRANSPQPVRGLPQPNGTVGDVLADAQELDRRENAK